MQIDKETVLLYADGACSPNPGKGGYGIILIDNGKRRELSGGFILTTNNRMELVSIIEGLRAVERLGSDVMVFSDSRYVVDAYSNRKAHQWQENDWMRTKRDAAKNPDLWDQLLTLCKTHNVVMQWVAGHAGHAENERCDELAVTARMEEILPEDKGYLKPFEPQTMNQTLLELF